MISLCSCFQIVALSCIDICMGFKSFKSCGVVFIFTFNTQK